MSGKAISRAIRGHLLVTGALNAMITSKAFDIPVSHMTAVQEGQEQVDINEEEPAHELQESVTLEPDQATLERIDDLSLPEVLTTAGKLYDNLMEGSTTLESMQNSQVLQVINQKLTDCKAAMQKQLTASLWLQYLEMVSILQMFSSKQNAPVIGNCI